MPRKHPQGATHCKNPGSLFDPIYYRINEGVLEVFVMARNEWQPSAKTMGYWFNELHVLEECD